MERDTDPRTASPGQLDSESLQSQIKEEIFNCQRSFASTLHMMSRKVQKNLFLFCREWKEDINVPMCNSILHSTVN